MSVTSKLIPKSHKDKSINLDYVKLKLKFSTSSLQSVKLCNSHAKGVPHNKKRNHCSSKYALRLRHFVTLQPDLSRINF